MNVPDNYDQWEAHERQQERQRSKYPSCDICGEALYEYCYQIEGKTLCSACVNLIYREEVDIDE